MLSILEKLYLTHKISLEIPFSILKRGVSCEWKHEEHASQVLERLQVHLNKLECRGKVHLFQ